MKCRICNQDKALDCFYFKDKSTGRMAKECKDCRNAADRQKLRTFRQTNPEGYAQLLQSRRRGGKKGHPLACPVEEPKDWTAAIKEWLDNRRSDASGLLPMSRDWPRQVSAGTLSFFAAVVAMNRIQIENIKYLIRLSRDPARVKKRNAKNNLPGMREYREMRLKERCKDPAKLAVMRSAGMAYFMANKPKVYAYRKQQRETNPQFRIGNNLRTYIYQRVGRKTTTGQSRFREIVGCSIADFCKWLEDHFEPWMNWTNYGKGYGKWSIDHTLPCASFNLTISEQVKKCFHFSNMLPMAWEANLSKSDALSC